MLTRKSEKTFPTPLHAPASGRPGDSSSVLPSSPCALASAARLEEEEEEEEEEGAWGIGEDMYDGEEEEEDSTRLQRDPGRSRKTGRVILFIMNRGRFALRKSGVRY
jgi:hypothetical protein